VPQLWPLEVLNGLNMAERRKRIDAARRKGLAAFLRALPITVDADTATEAWDGIQRLAIRFRLTLYDAAYLELAQRRELPLATLDKQLRTAATGLGVRLLGGS
jgi:predicted nucleic acid-binding protein